MVGLLRLVLLKLSYAFFGGLGLGVIILTVGTAAGVGLTAGFTVSFGVTEIPSYCALRKFNDPINTTIMYFLIAIELKFNCQKQSNGNHRYNF